MYARFADVISSGHAFSMCDWVGNLGVYISNGPFPDVCALVYIGRQTEFMLHTILILTFLLIDTIHCS